LINFVPTPQFPSSFGPIKKKFDTLWASCKTLALAQQDLLAEYLAAQFVEGRIFVIFYR